MMKALCCGGGLRLAVYLKSKNAKKYRHGIEYGSACWGTREDIAPYVDPVFQNNVILTKTESLQIVRGSVWLQHLKSRKPPLRLPRY